MFLAPAPRGLDTSAGTRNRAQLPFCFSGCLFILLFCSKMPHVAASALDPGRVPHPLLLGQGRQRQVRKLTRTACLRGNGLPSAERACGEGRAHCGAFERPWGRLPAGCETAGLSRDAVITPCLGPASPLSAPLPGRPRAALGVLTPEHGGSASPAPPAFSPTISLRTTGSRETGAAVSRP